MNYRDGVEGHKDHRGEPDVLFPYENLNSYVESFVLVMYQPYGRSEPRWCADWYNHPSANFLLTALFAGFQHASQTDADRGSGDAMLNYLLGHFFPVMDRLTDRAGTFRKCSIDQCGYSKGETFVAEVRFHFDDPTET